MALVGGKFLHVGRPARVTGDRKRSIHVSVKGAGIAYLPIPGAVVVYMLALRAGDWRRWWINFESCNLVQRGAADQHAIALRSPDTFCSNNLAGPRHLVTVCDPRIL